MNVENSNNEFESSLEDRSKEYLAHSGNCAQSCFAALQDEFDLKADDILKALTPFPGLALRGETCGAITGSLMALGLVYGRNQLNNQRGYIASLPSARKFCASFEKEFGGTTCSQILEEKMGKSFNLIESSEAKEYITNGGQEVCGEVVALASRLAADLIRKKRK
ncbi:C-GCAxxG-C-C family protein [Desulforhopalus sp. 52FAK]